MENGSYVIHGRILERYYGKDSACIWAPGNWGQQEVVPDKNFEEELEQATIFEDFENVIEYKSRRTMQLIAASDTEHTNTLRTKTKNMKEHTGCLQEPRRRTQQIAARESEQTNALTTINKNTEEITRGLPRPYRKKPRIAKSATLQTNTPITRNKSIKEVTRCLQEHHRIKQHIPKSDTEQTNTMTTRHQSIKEITRCLPKPSRGKQRIENSERLQTNAPIKRNKNIEETTRCLQGPCRKMPHRAVSNTEQTNKGRMETPLLYNIFGQAQRVSVSNLLRHLELKIAKPSKMRDSRCHCNMVAPPTALHTSDTGAEESDADDGDYEDREKLLPGGGDLNEAGIPNISHTGLSDIITEVRGRVHTSGPSDILLDGNTVYNFLRLQDDRKTVSWSFINQNLPETAERFAFRPQVLSSRSFWAGSHWWDVEVWRSDNWRVGVGYPSIDRKGGVQSVIGNNEKSWCLSRSHDRYSMIHDRKETCLFGSISGSAVRISLNYESGLISFYELGVSARHLHTFTATFTEPLHAMLGVWRGCVKISGVQ